MPASSAGVGLGEAAAARLELGLPAEPEGAPTPGSAHARDGEDSAAGLGYAMVNDVQALHLFTRSSSVRLHTRNAKHS